jgi:hypothetical protein
MALRNVGALARATLRAIGNTMAVAAEFEIHIDNRNAADDVAS